MINKHNKHVTQSKQYITQKDYIKIKDLEEVCRSHDGINLKLELDYKLAIGSASKNETDPNNEIFYYIDDILIGYLGISSFGGTNVGELNGMVHPNYRRLGVFTKMLDLARVECEKTKYKKVLLLSDGKSDSGLSFIRAQNVEYDFSEYRMRKMDKSIEKQDTISLRKATSVDITEIVKQNTVYFNFDQGEELDIKDIEAYTKPAYMSVLDGTVIGKINIKIKENTVFLSGFGVMPEYRGNGYGRDTMLEALRIVSNNRDIDIVELDVECKNNTALNLYKRCGFKEMSVMDYYIYKI